MLLNYGLYVVGAAINGFYVVFVENLVVPVIFRKMFIDKVQKISADVCLHVHAVGRLEKKLCLCSCSCSCSVRCDLQVSCVMCTLTFRRVRFV